MLAYNFSLAGEVLELADRRDLGSRVERREGSTPSFPIFTKVYIDTGFGRFFEIFTKYQRDIIVKYCLEGKTFEN